MYKLEIKQNRLIISENDIPRHDLPLKNISIHQHPTEEGVLLNDVTDMYNERKGVTLLFSKMEPNNISEFLTLIEELKNKDILPIENISNKLLTYMPQFVDKLDNLIASSDAVKNSVDELEGLTKEVKTTLTTQTTTLVDKLSEIKNKINEGVLKDTEIQEEISGIKGLFISVNTLLEQIKNKPNVDLTNVENLLTQINNKPNPTETDLTNVENLLSQINSKPTISLDNVEALLQQIKNKPNIDISNVESLLNDIKNKPNVDLTNVENLLTQINNKPNPTETDLTNVENLLSQINSKPTISLDNVEALLQQIKNKPNTDVSDIESLLNDIKNKPSVDVSNIESLLNDIKSKPNVDVSNIESLLNDIKNKPNIDVSNIEGLLNDIKNKPSIDVSNIESLLNDIKNKPNVDIQPILNYLQNLKQELQDVEDDIEESLIHQHPVVTKGFIQKFYNFSYNSPLYININNNTYCYGMTSESNGEEDNQNYHVDGKDCKLPGGTIIIKHANENLVDIPEHILTERYADALEELGWVENKKIVKAQFHPRDNDSKNSGKLVVISDKPFTNYYGKRLTNTGVASGNAYMFFQFPATMIQFFDRIGNELESKRKYFREGNILLEDDGSIANKINRGDFVLKLSQKNTTSLKEETQEKTYSNFKSLYVLVKEGSANIQTGFNEPVNFSEGMSMKWEGKFITKIKIIPESGSKVLTSVIY